MNAFAIKICFATNQNLQRYWTAHSNFETDTKMSGKFFQKTHQTPKRSLLVWKLQYTLSQYPGGDCSTFQGKCEISKNFPRSDLGVNFPLGRQLNLLEII